MKYLLLSLLLPLNALAIDPPSGATIPVAAEESPGTPIPAATPANTGTVDEWTAWGEKEVEIARHNAAMLYAKSNAVAGARCIYSIDGFSRTDTIDVETENGGYKVTCFATKKNSPDIYLLTFHNVMIKQTPDGCASSDKIRAHFTLDISRKVENIPFFKQSFLAPTCTMSTQSVESTEAAKINLADVVAKSWFEGEMNNRMGLRTPGEKAINASKAVKKSDQSDEGSSSGRKCVPGNPLNPCNADSAN